MNVQDASISWGIIHSYPSKKSWTTSAKPASQTCPDISSGNVCTSIMILPSALMFRGKTTPFVPDIGMSMLHSNALAVPRLSALLLLNKKDGTKNSGSTWIRTPKTVRPADATIAIRDYFGKNMIVTLNRRFNQKTLNQRNTWPMSSTKCILMVLICLKRCTRTERFSAIRSLESKPRTTDRLASRLS